jgi:hypothetical protein
MKNTISAALDVPTHSQSVATTVHTIHKAVSERKLPSLTVRKKPITTVHFVRVSIVVGRTGGVVDGKADR